MLIGVLGSVVLFTLWIGSAIVGVVYGASRWFVGCGGGSAVVSILPGSAAPAQLGWLIARNPKGQPMWPGLTTGGWGYLRPTSLVLPLWIPAVILAAATVFWWRRDRSFPAGHCQHCGYNLTGNQSGICPECGCATNI